ncbi:MAG TPA: TVP38/TMEM64 family protein [Leptolyngbyaceae cyanobacterium M33_DOE_097]|uniref:TVP38/TMEM64 family membrane protein n=1 Tax=Oscillatoriales cyanobacterium SpSt-418 TaxID=2282169 RepID=A0A7C3KHU0_9CYAN|nr:TVP38/TMEM64 family protein [Leptolyngbyaceae cyanobacterium M33_DOE_097]
MMKCTRKQRCRYVVALVGLGLGLAIACGHSWLSLSLHRCLVVIQQMEHWGVVAYILVYNLATVCFMPGSLLALAAGVLFGWFWGLVYGLLAAVLGATIAFLVGRYVAREWVCQRWGHLRYFQGLNQAVTQQGCKIVFLTRLSPLFPFNLLNYLFGVTQVSLKDYVFGSFGIFPGTLLYVYLGSLTRDFAQLDRAGSVMASLPAELHPLLWGIRIIGLLSAIATTLYLSRLAKKYLAELGLSAVPTTVSSTFLPVEDPHDLS